jgi:hypothetical protein
MKFEVVLSIGCDDADLFVENSIFGLKKKNECHVQTSGSIYKIIHRSQLTTQYRNK